MHEHFHACSKCPMCHTEETMKHVFSCNSEPAMTVRAEVYPLNKHHTIKEQS